MQRFVDTHWLSALLLLVANVATAQHSDVLLQSDGAKIAVGSANFTGFSWTIGTRVFARDFDSDYEIDNPGFNSLSNGSPFLPSGYVALPGSSPVSWDFLPMTVDSGVANLLFWNGLDSNANGVDILDVAFAGPLGYTLALEGAVADGSSQFVPGSVLAVTDSDGSLHYHRAFTLDDGDLNTGTNPVDGIYLVALQMRMDALESTNPFFLVFGTPGSTLVARNAAVAWIQERVDTLVEIGLPGDYNDDHVVDAADYTVWRDALGLLISLPNEDASPNAVDAADYDVWKSHFGESASDGAAAISAANVPEPATALISVTAALALSLTTWRPRRAHRALG